MASPVVSLTSTFGTLFEEVRKERKVKSEKKFQYGEDAFGLVDFRPRVQVCDATGDE